MIHFLQENTHFKNIQHKRLNGYDNVNYLLTSNQGKFVFKTYTFEEDLLSLLKAENECLLFLQNHSTNRYPKPIPFTDGSFIKIADINGQKSICRILTYLEGELLGNTEINVEQIQSLGTLIAEMDAFLLNYSNESSKARKFIWDLQYLDLNEPYFKYISNKKDQSLVRYFYQQFKENVRHHLPYLRHAIIHGDVNEWNTLTRNNEIIGFIDFGDVCYTPLINEIAIAATYSAFNKENPLFFIKKLIQSYHKTLPLLKEELDVLYYLIAGRLITSLTQSAYSKFTNPENTYASISENNAWKLLRKWLTINPIHAQNEFYKAVGFEVEKPKPIQDAINRRYQVVSPLLSISYDEAIYVDKAAFQYMYDKNGNTFLDAYNNIPHVGHSHPKVIETGQRQMAKLNTNTRYVYDILAEYSEKLLATFPKNLNKIFFVNSGSAATDLAIRLAKAHTSHSDIMVMEHGYHGNTQIGIDVSDYKFNHPKGQGQQSYILKTKIPDTFRGKYTLNDDTAGHQYAQESIKQIKESPNGIAAFISETIVGCGGQIPLAKGYLKEIYPAIRNQGGVCISDEVQTGFGRLGDYFWSFEGQGVVPDIVILGKPMANGHPIGAVVTTSEIASSFEKGVEFFSSFGGNPVSCAIGLSVLNVLEEEKLQENAKIIGDYYQLLMKELQKEYSCIADVRGEGLFLGFEITEWDSLKPNPKLARYIKNEMRRRHILISTDGPFNNVIKSKPPLCFNKNNVEQVVNELYSILKNKKR